MADTHGNTPNPLIDELVKHPYGFDFFRAVRLLESERPDLPRVGFSISPASSRLSNGARRAPSRQEHVGRHAKMPGQSADVVER